MASNKPLCYILCTRPPKHYWAGRGRLVPLAEMCLSGLPHWPDKLTAGRAACGIYATLGYELYPLPLRLP